jgi:hypothetical protein
MDDNSALVIITVAFMAFCVLEAWVEGKHKK